MTSTRKATPLHILVLVTLLATYGGIMQLKQSHPAFDIGALYSRIQAVTRSEPVLSAEDEEALRPAPEAVRETTAQKRARYAPHIAAAARASKVDSDLIEAIMTAESAFNPLAVSRTGAMGLMQLMPATAERFGVTDPWDPAQNIMGGAKYLSFLLHRFKNNHKLAIAAYNAGEGNVKKHRNKIPPFAETRKYVPKVLAFYSKYRAEG